MQAGQTHLGSGLGIDAHGHQRPGATRRLQADLRGQPGEHHVEQFGCAGGHAVDGRRREQESRAFLDLRTEDGAQTVAGRQMGPQRLAMGEQYLRARRPLLGQRGQDDLVQPDLVERAGGLLDSWRGRGDLRPEHGVAAGEGIVERRLHPRPTAVMAGHQRQSVGQLRGDLPQGVHLLGGQSGEPVGEDGGRLGKGDRAVAGDRGGGLFGG